MVKLDTLSIGKTIKAPPPPTSTQAATNFPFAAIKFPSKAQLVTRKPSKQPSLRAAVPKTCRNLEERTNAMFLVPKTKVRVMEGQPRGPFFLGLVDQLSSGVFFPTPPVVSLIKEAGHKWHRHPRISTASQRR